MRPGEFLFRNIPNGTKCMEVKQLKRFRRNHSQLYELQNLTPDISTGYTKVLQQKFHGFKTDNFLSVKYVP
jgi:hypothetical protein